MAQTTKRLAVCILNWNGLEQTKQCVTALLESTYKNFDIIILDNGSVNNEAKPLEQTFVNNITTYRSEENLGFAGGYNYLILDLLKNNVYTYYLLLNQDALVTPNCIEQLIKHLENNPNTAVVGPKVLAPDNTIQSLGADINLVTGKITSRFQEQDICRDALQCVSTNPEPVDVVIGNCFMVRANTIQQLGLFDTNYFAYYEEADWCLRAKQANLTCAVVPQAVIFHHKIGKFRTYLIVRNMIWFEKKFASPIQLVQFFWYFWFVFFFERLKKGSRFSELLIASIDGWFGLNKGQAKFL
ncbi:MAG: glycosyltransferase family 2 protein [Patescibacteria group bacterium]|jgi:hypothetical protein